MRTIILAMILSIFSTIISLSERSKASGINSKMRSTKFIQVRHANQSSNITNTTNSTMNGTNSTNSTMNGTNTTDSSNLFISNLTTFSATAESTNNSINPTLKPYNMSSNVKANKSNGMVVNFAYSLLFFTISVLLL